MKGIAATIATALLLIGCLRPRDDVAARTRLGQQAREIARLSRELEQAKQQLAAQQRHIDTLQDLGPDRLEKLQPVQRIRLGRFTGGYDSSGDGAPDAVKVYLEPIDAAGSAVKAAGTVTIEVFDLTADQPVTLTTCRFDVEEVAEHWRGGVFTYHYSFVCPWGGPGPAGNEITVRVTFIDYLTGKTFTTQKHCFVQRDVARATGGSSTE